MRVLPEPRLEGTYRLRNGRRLGFAEYGRPDGKVVFWFHGTPGGRRQVAPQARALAQEMGIRLIVLERPGIGESTPHLYRNVGAFADDVLEVADGLGAREFACVGLSGGGPYVLACAARAPGRVVAGAVLGGVAPTRGPDAVAGGLVSLAKTFAPVIEFARGVTTRVLNFAVKGLMPFRTQALELYIKISPEGDQRVFQRPEMRAMFLEDIVRSTARQVHAPVLDVVLFTRPWGFSLRDVRVPIRFWHGDADHIVPLSHAEHMVARVEQADLLVRPGESHLGTLDAGREIFEFLLSHGPDTRDEGDKGEARPAG